MIDTENKSYQVTAEIEVAKWATHGSGTGIKDVIAAQGSNFGRWALYTQIFVYLVASAYPPRQN